MEVHTLQDVLKDQLADLYSAEQEPRTSMVGHLPARRAPPCQWAEAPPTRRVWLVPSR